MQIVPVAAQRCRAGKKARCHAGLEFSERGGAQAPWHFLNFFSLPQGQGSLRPTVFSGLRIGSWLWLQCGPWTWPWSCW